MFRAGIDVGGTFTDVYARDIETGKEYKGKSLTTPDDLSRGIINAVKVAGIDLHDVDVIVHGTTVATNSLLQKSYYGFWPKVAFISSEGFRDTLEIRRGRNEYTIDMYGTAPEPLIRRRNRFTLAEKIDADGKIIRGLDKEELKELIDRIKKMNPDSVAICFLNSYANPANEITAKEAIEQELPGLPVYISIDIAPKFRELGRMITVATRAILAPITGDYMDKLEQSLKENGFAGKLLMVKGDGSICTTDAIRASPEALLESGPAAGVYAGAVIMKSLGMNNSLTQDVGGTSFDTCIIEKGAYFRTLEYEIDLDMPLIIPMIDVRSIGTGGGSIVWVDEGGSMRVGPRSAGSKPGPVCYRLGGREPTITDANVIVGRVDITLGGKMELDVDAAKKAIKEKIADRIGKKDVYEVAEAAIKIACANMAMANMLVTTSRGRDPRAFSPIFFGGAGGMHACGVADELGQEKIVIPPASGVTSAMGMVIMPLGSWAEQTLYMELANPDIERVKAIFKELEEKTTNELIAQGATKEDISSFRELDMRYVGQNYEVTVREPSDFDFGNGGLEKLNEDFNASHLLEHGINNPAFPPAIVNVRVIATGKIPAGFESLPQVSKATYGVEKALKGRKPVYFEGKFYDTLIYDYDKLMSGHKLDGPAVIELKDSCTVVFPQWRALVGDYGNVVMEKK